MAKWKKLLNEDPNSNAYIATAGTKRKAVSHELIVASR